MFSINLLNKEFVQKLLNSPIVTSSAATIVFTAGIHVLNYIYILFCVRFLTPLEYSDLALIISFYTFMGIFSTTMAATSLSLLSKDFNTDRYAALKQNILQTNSIISYIVFAIAMLILTPIIHFYFKIDSLLEIIIILTGGMFTMGNALLSVHFQMQKEFIRNGFFGFTASFFKLLFSVIFLFLGYKIFGVAAALFLSGLITFLLFYPKKQIANYKNIFIPKLNYINSTKSFLDKNKSLIFKTFISSLVMVMCIIIDTILAKRLLSASDAAQYIGMATLAKLFLYSINAISVVVFPYILNKDKHHMRAKIFNYYMLLIMFCGLITLIIANFFAAPLISLILDSGYILASFSFAYVALLSIASTFAYLIINLASMLQTKNFNQIVAFVAVIGMAILMFIQPHSIITLTLTLSSIFALLSFLLYYIDIRKELV